MPLLPSFFFLSFYVTIPFNHRYFIAYLSMLKRCQSEVLSNTYRSSIEDKAKFYRRQSEVLSKTYRTSIEDLSKTYRTSIEHLSKRSWVRFFILTPYGLSVMPKKGVPIFILTHPLFITFFIGNKSQCG